MTIEPFLNSLVLKRLQLCRQTRQTLPALCALNYHGVPKKFKYKNFFPYSKNMYTGKCIRISTNVKTSQHLFKCLERSQKPFQNVSKMSQNVSNISKCPKCLKNVSKCLIYMVNSAAFDNHCIAFFI